MHLHCVLIQLLLVLLAGIMMNRNLWTKVVLAALILPAQAIAQTNLGFSPWIGSNCYSEVREGEVNHGQCVLNATTNGYPRWVVSGSHENADFSGGSQHDLWLSDPVMGVSFIPRIDYPDKYEVLFKLDKISYPGYREHSSSRDIRHGHTGIFLAETAATRRLAQKPVFDLSQNVNIWLEVKLEQMTQTILDNPEWVGNAEIRFIVGAMAVWNGRPHYLEINLLRTSGYDRCGDLSIAANPGNPFTWRPLLGEIAATQIYNPYPSGLGAGDVCDSTGAYDHRYVGLDGSGIINKTHVTMENVYMLVSKMPESPQQPLVVGAGYRGFDIPIAKLFRSYNWVDKPINPVTGELDWSVVKSHNAESTQEISFYVGFEIYGAGSATAKVRALNIYR